MDAVKYLKEKERMTDKCRISCNTCRLYFRDIDGELKCMQHDYPEEAVSIVEKWSKEHPIKTMLQYFIEQHPKAKLDPDGTPAVCPYQLRYTDDDGCPYGNFNCVVCWNRPVEDR